MDITVGEDFLNLCDKKVPTKRLLYSMVIALWEILNFPAHSPAKSATMHEVRYATLNSWRPGALFTTERRGVLRQRVGLRELALNTGHCKLQAVSFINVNFVRISCLVFILFHIFSVIVYLLFKSQVAMNP